MTIETYLLYLGVCAAFFATPPDTSQLLVVSNSLRHGLKRTTSTIAGDLSANALQMCLAAFGLTALITTNANTLWAIKWAGVAYLVWIGLGLVLSKPDTKTVAQAPKGKLFRQGFVTSSANPYAVLFFGALFPQFIDPSVSIWPQLLVLGLTYLVIDGVLLVLWGWAAMRSLGRVKALTGVWLNRISGSLMISAAALLGMKDIQKVNAK